MAKNSTVYLQAAIQALHEYVLQEQDPKDVQDASQCMARLAAIQTRHMQAPQGAQGTVVQGLGA